MSEDYLMPKLAMAMNEGTISEWLVSSGARVERGQLIATVETEKVAYDLESPRDGYLHLVAAAGETVPVETRIGLFFSSEADLRDFLGGDTAQGSTDSTDTGSTPTAAPSADERHSTTDAPSQRVKASPLARKLAKDYGLNLRSMTGTGPGGRIVKRDVESARQTQPAGLDTAAAAERDGDAITKEGERVLATIPISGVRGAIAKRLRASMQDSAQLSIAWESDLKNLLALRETYLEREAQFGTRISVNSLIARAIVSAVRAVPIANACVIDDEIRIYESVSLGFAIALPGDTAFDSQLKVGVLHNVEAMGIAEIDRELKALVTRVRGGNASTRDLSGSTITLSSTANIGPPGLVTTPILHAPNVTLVGTSTPIRRPMAVGDRVEVRPMLPVSLTFDHCAYDGDLAAQFSAQLHQCLEEPGLMLT